MGRRSFIRDAFASTLQQTALSDATNTLSATYRATAAAAAAVAVAVGAVGKQESEVVAVPSTATPSTTETFSGEAAKSLRHMRLRQRALEYYAEFVDFQRRLKGRQPVSVQQLLDLVDTTNTVKGSADRAAFKLVLEQFVLFFVQSNIQRNGTEK